MPFFPLLFCFAINVLLSKSARHAKEARGRKLSEKQSQESNGEDDWKNDSDLQQLGALQPSQVRWGERNRTKKKRLDL